MFDFVVVYDSRKSRTVVLLVTQAARDAAINTVDCFGCQRE